MPLAADLFAYIGAGLEDWVVLTLLASSFAASFITVALGIGGGALLLAIMASLLPPAALIPVHGVVQMGSNISRMALLARHIDRRALGGFAIGSVIGAALGALIFGVVQQGLFFAGVESSLFRVFLGIILLFAVILNTYIRRMITGEH